MTNSVARQSSSEDGAVRIWRAEGGYAMILSTFSMGDRVRYIALSSDAQSFAAAMGNNSVRVVEAATGNQVKILSGHSTSHSLTAVAFSWDDELIASCSTDYTIRLWLKPRRGTSA